MSDAKSRFVRMGVSMPGPEAENDLDELLFTLPKEELAKVTPPTDEAFVKALQTGRKIRDGEEASASTTVSVPNILFK
jgi:hypothetical protein